MAKMITPAAVATTSVTNTHMALATLAMLAAGGFAYIAAASTPATTLGACVDPDATSSFDQNQLFTPTTTPGLKTDYCYTQPSTGKTYLMEGICNANGNKATWNKNCAELGADYQCVSGACVKATPVVPVTTCTDGDGGLNLSTASQVSVSVSGQPGGGVILDTCMSSSTISEGICNGNTAATTTLGCGSGFVCNSGACITDPANALQISWDENNPRSIISPYGNNSFYGTVGKIRLTNSKTVPITIKNLNVNVSSNLPTDSSRTLYIVKQTQNVTITVATKSFGRGVQFSDTTFADSNFTDVTIPAQSSVVLEVQTSALTQNDSYITVGVGADDIQWSDGTNSFTTAPSLPLSPLTLAAFPRTDLSITWLSDTPSGISTARDDQLVGKVQINNNDAYEATIKTLNFSLTQNGVNPLAAPREMKVYRETISPETLLATVATTTFIGGGSYWREADFVDTILPPGGTKLFIFTLDTQDAGRGDSLTIGMPLRSVEWSDGWTPLISTPVSGLPLPPKTLTY